jgi:hypothetical protein
MLARSNTLHHRGRRYVCSPITRRRVIPDAMALRARQGPAAAFGGALRAALTRARTMARSQRDEGKPSSLVNERTCDRGLQRTFYLTEESRYAC